MISRKFLLNIYGWIFVRPRRWIFWRMVCTAYGPRFLPARHEYFGHWQMPDIHWWILYKTVFKFCKWLHYDAWRPFCTWDRVLKRKPLIAKIIHRIGSTTAGYAIGGGECYHCGSTEGCQIELSEDETGTNFILVDSWTVGTQEGTDYRFKGVTICPKCGYNDEFEDGSL